jgi:hypothetical protein
LGSSASEQAAFKSALSPTAAARVSVNPRFIFESVSTVFELSSFAGSFFNRLL